MNNTTHQELIYRHVVTHNTEEHAAAWRGWEITCDQVTDGQFEGFVTELSFTNGMQLIRDRANQALVKKGRAIRNCLTFSIPVQTQLENFYCNGHLSESNQVLIAPSEHLPELHTPSDLELFCISVDFDVIQKVLESQQLDFKLDIYSNSSYLKKIPIEPELTTFLDSIFATELNSPLLSYARIQDGIRDTIMQHLVDLADSDDHYLITPLARKHMVDKARDYVLAHLESPPTILELCNIVGASRRKLQYCFQETFGLSPITYLRIMRLNAAHRDLLNNEQNLSIQDIAAKWGFLHFGRFSSEYRNLFGELPSDTLKKQ